MDVNIDDCEKIKDLEERLACYEEKYEELTKLLKHESDSENLTEDASMYSNLYDQRRLVKRQIKKITLALKNQEKSKSIKRGIHADIGSYVEVRNTKSYHKLFLVESIHEANPAKGYISISSPLGKAIYGKSVGEDVYVTSPTGDVHYKIEVIE